MSALASTAMPSLTAPACDGRDVVIEMYFGLKAGFPGGTTQEQGVLRVGTGVTARLNRAVSPAGGVDRILVLGPNPIGPSRSSYLSRFGVCLFCHACVSGSCRSLG